MYKGLRILQGRIFWTLLMEYGKLVWRKTRDDFNKMRERRKNRKKKTGR